MDQRIAGQDTSVTVSAGGVPIKTITAIRSFEVTVKMQIKSEEYLGETAPRKDDFFDGVTGKVELDMENSDSISLVETIRVRAQNRAISTKIGFKSTLQYPDGDRVIIVISDAFFSDIPISFGSRTDYGKMTLTFEASGYRIVSR